VAAAQKPRAVDEENVMIGLAGMNRFLVGFLAVIALFASTLSARAQLVDTPQNLLKAWTEAYATRQGEPMSRVYSSDAQFWGTQSKDPSVGLSSIKQHFDRTGQGVTERSATISKVQFLPRKRVTIVTGIVDLKAKLKDGTARNNQARFSMTIVRESRRQWAILSHHVSFMPN
jgi:uncharacterized protein (TIGR02246 family)